MKYQQHTFWIINRFGFSTTDQEDLLSKGQPQDAWTLIILKFIEKCSWNQPIYLAIACTTSSSSSLLCLHIFYLDIVKRVRKSIPELNYASFNTWAFDIHTSSEDSALLSLSQQTCKDRQESITKAALGIVTEDSAILVANMICKRTSKVTKTQVQSQHNKSAKGNSLLQIGNALAVHSGKPNWLIGLVGHKYAKQIST